MHRTIEASRAAARWSGALARFVVLATGAPWAPAHAQAPAAVDAAALMPDSFSNVQLGMTHAKLLRARPAIRPDGFKGDNAGHAKLLFVDAYASKLEAMDKATQDKLKQEMRDQLRKVPATVKYQ